jgi:hypothetical protein
MYMEDLICTALLCSPHDLESGHAVLRVRSTVARERLLSTRGDEYLYTGMSPGRAMELWQSGGSAKLRFFWTRLGVL